MMLEYRVNRYITLKLEKKKTNIYVKGQNLGLYCKKLILNLKPDELQNFDKFSSMDEFADHYIEKSNKNHSLKGQLIDPKVEFQAHCSNIQVWAENDYDTRLLHSGLSFPLLKKLTEMGDPVAKKVFKDEIAYRFSSNNINTQRFLAEEGYLTYLNDEEFESLLIHYKEANIYEVLGLVYSSKGHEYVDKQELNASNKYFQKAKEHFESFLEVNSKRWDVWGELAHVLLHLGKYEEVIEKYQESIKLNSEQENAWFEIGIALNELNRYSEAIVAFQNSIDIDPNRDFTWRHLGRSLYKLWKYEEAVEKLNKALEINPDNAITWNALGGVLMKLNRYNEAIVTFQNTINIDPNRDFTWQHLGISLYKLGKYEEAVEKFKKALEINPDNEVAYYALMKLKMIK